MNFYALSNYIHLAWTGADSRRRGNPDAVGDQPPPSVPVAK